MKIRHLQKVDATNVVDDNNKQSEEKVDTGALFSLLKKTAAPQDDSEEEADSQASVVLGKWTKTALDEDATTIAQLKAPKRSIRKAAPTATYTTTATTATKEKEPLESHHRQKHIVKLGSDGSVLDSSNQEITRLNFGVQHDNNVSTIIADFSALSWANNGVIELYTPVISFCSKDTPETVISYIMNTSEQWPNDKSAEFYIPQEVTNITNGVFLFSLQEKKATEGNVHTAPEIWVSKTVSFYTAPNIFNNSMLTPNEPDLNIDSLAYLSKNRIGVEDIKSVNLGYDFSFGKFPIILGEKFDQYVKLVKLAADLMWNYECSKGFLLLKPTTAAITDQPTVCRFQAIKDKNDSSKNNYYCILPKKITENAQSYTIAVAIADDKFKRIYWSSNQIATVIDNFLSNIGQLTNNLKEGFNTNISSGLITADNYVLISSDGYIIDTIENQ